MPDLSSTQNVLVWVAGTLVTVFIGWLSVRATSKQTQHATDTQANTAREQAALAGAGTAVEGFDRLTNQLGKRLGDVETRLEGVERELRDTNRVLRSAVAYIERLLDFIADVVPHRPDTPPIPQDLHDHLPPSVIDDWRTPGT